MRIELSSLVSLLFQDPPWVPVEAVDRG